MNRAGFTLVEMMIVIVILGVVAGVSVPAIRDARATSPLEQATDEARGLLGRARRTAVERATPVTIVLDPATRRYWVRVSQFGADSAIADSLRVPPSVTLDGLAPRLAITFVPTGEARGDTLTLRWQDHVAAVSADAWTGDARVTTR